MKAKKIFYRKIHDTDGYITEMVIWQLPETTVDRPHGLKYRLYYGDSSGTCLVRYDNEEGKGDHKHLKGEEYSYSFKTVEGLMDDFFEDIEQIRIDGGENE